MKRLMAAVLFVLLVMLFVGAASAEKMDLVQNPKFSDLEGKWEGSYSADCPRCNGSVDVSFYMEKNGVPVMSYVAGSRSFTSISISFKGNEIIIDSNESGDRRNDTCKLSKGSDGKLVFKCDYAVQRLGGRPWNGTLTLEKKK
jgi:hypothetical protein